MDDEPAANAGFPAGDEAVSPLAHGWRSTGWRSNSARVAWPWFTWPVMSGLTGWWR